jgi:hypothetical protein
MGQDFLPCSYGFRPGRSAHQALRTLQNVLWAKRLYWVLDIDPRNAPFLTEGERNVGRDGPRLGAFKHR